VKIFKLELPAANEAMLLKTFTTELPADNCW